MHHHETPSSWAGQKLLSTGLSTILVRHSHSSADLLGRDPGWSSVYKECCDLSDPSCDSRTKRPVNKMFHWSLLSAVRKFLFTSWSDDENNIFLRMLSRSDGCEQNIEFMHKKNRIEGAKGQISGRKYFFFKKSCCKSQNKHFSIQKLKTIALHAQLILGVVGMNKILNCAQRQNARCQREVENCFSKKLLQIAKGALFLLQNAKILSKLRQTDL